MKTKKLNIMGIIGVRSGSKGVKDKNIRNLAGKPLVGWIIDKAKSSKYINKLVVSTDSQEYKEIAESYGAEVPYLRPKRLSEDFSPELDYIKHMIDWLYKKESYTPDIIVRMMATTPLQTTHDIDSSIHKLLENQSSDSVVVVSEARQHPLKALKIIQDKNNESKLVTYFSESGREVTPIARQNYEKAYFRSNIITCRVETIKNTNSLTGDNVFYHIIDQHRGIDIDNIVDFRIAEHLINLQK